MKKTAYTITLNFLIDLKEGWNGDLFSSIYRPINVDVVLEGKMVRDVLTYEVIKKGKYRPSQEYLNIVLDGAVENGLPGSYVEKLKAFRLYSIS